MTDTIAGQPGTPTWAVDPDYDPDGVYARDIADTLVAGVHFPEATSPADIGWKALAVNLSDLAAMGAAPRLALLSMVVPPLLPLGAPPTDAIATWRL